MTKDDIVAITTKQEPRGASILGVATVSLSFGLSITVNVINGRKGLFVGMPSRKVGDGWEDVVKFDDKNDFFTFSNAVKEAWTAQQSDDKIEEDSFVLPEEDIF